MSVNGGVIAMKDATVSARVEYGVKTEAEEILQKLGIAYSSNLYIRFKIFTEFIIYNINTSIAL